MKELRFIFIAAIMLIALFTPQLGLIDLSIVVRSLCFIGVLYYLLFHPLFKPNNGIKS